MTDDILFRLRKEERERAELIRLWRVSGTLHGVVFDILVDQAGKVIKGIMLHGTGVAGKRLRWNGNSPLPR